MGQRDLGLVGQVGICFICYTIIYFDKAYIATDRFLARALVRATTPKDSQITRRLLRMARMILRR
jgi:hypothetical protein